MSILFLSSQFSKVADKLKPYLSRPASDLKVLFIETASNPYTEKAWQDDDYAKLVQMGFQVERFDLKDKTENQVREKLNTTDIIFVAGGNVAYLLQKSLECGFTYLVNEYVANGKLYIGSSAGSILAGPSIEPFLENDLRELEPDFKLASAAATNMVDFVILPHYQDIAYRKEYEEQIIPKYKDHALRSLTDDHAYLVLNREEKLL